ncbi:uncharacterized protein MCYG_08582 [Microsporum canis CBS 113480]|uniref:Uncharacterized protein n=1 Tax=Arthroderma otae (strain ATCC MYA-4605 / CBS 113480) TaxID=554155 RepID=C5G0W0_ARTOC|nr:uncharacterized protein MCYG_08582 [Microsporum canis CBS 113480]EEQ35763.1 predicted protein [Microsporum canis CBS 113480]
MSDECARFTFPLCGRPPPACFAVSRRIPGIKGSHSPVEMCGMKHERILLRAQKRVLKCYPISVQGFSSGFKGIPSPPPLLPASKNPTLCRPQPKASICGQSSIITIPASYWVMRLSGQRKGEKKPEGTHSPRGPSGPCGRMKHAMTCASPLVNWTLEVTVTLHCRGR